VCVCVCVCVCVSVSVCVCVCVSVCVWSSEAITLNTYESIEEVRLKRNK
jgi:hypothetical protein